MRISKTLSRLLVKYVVQNSQEKVGIFPPLIVIMQFLSVL